MFKNILQSIKDKIFPNKTYDTSQVDEIVSTLDSVISEESEAEELPETTRTRGEIRKEAREERKEERKEKVEERRNYRLEKIAAIKEKFYAVASKRKWLFFIIAGAIVAYLVIFKGGFGGGYILTKIKGFFG